MNKLATHIVCLSLFLGAVLTSYSQAGWENFHRLTVQNGLPNAKVFHVSQDQQGFLWFSTESGLCRYDGFEYEYFTVEKGIRSNDIRRVFHDKEGDLWVQSLGGVTVDDGFGFQAIQALSDDDRWLHMYEDSQERIWASNYKYVRVLDKEGKLIREYQRSESKTLQRPDIQFLDANDHAWVYTWDGLSVLSVDSLIRYIPLDPTMEQPSDFASVLLRDGRILFNTREGLSLLNQHYERQDIPLPNSTLSTNNVQHILEGANGDIWVASAYSGAYQFRWKGDTLFQVDRLLPNIKILHMMLDREGNLWFTTDSKGVFMLNRHAAAAASSNPFPEVMNILAYKDLFVADGPDGGFWLTTAKGELYLGTTEGGKESWELQTQLDLGSDFNLITDLISTGNGGLLILTEEGIILYEDGKSIPIKGLYDVNAVSPTRDGSYLIATEDFFDFKLSLEDIRGLTESLPMEKSERWQEEGKAYPAEGSLQSGEDGTGTIWVYWPRGIFSLIGAERDKRNEEGGIFEARVNDMVSGPDGWVWMATAGSGILLRKGEDIRQINDTQGLRSLLCRHIYIDEAKQTAWVSTNLGIGKIHPITPDSGAQYSVEWIDKTDGLRSDDVYQVFARGERLFAATANGLSVLDQRSFDIPSLPPPVYITRVLGKEELPLQQSYVLPYDDNSLDIHFTGLSFLHMGKLQFQYQINNSSWQTAPGRVIRLASLSNGSYEVKVRALTPDGVTSPEPYTLSIEIKPIFYKTWWFIGLMVLVFLGLGYFLLRFIYTERQRVELERSVDEKTLELNQRLEELHRTNQDLQQFAYVASHDLKTPLRTVISHLQLIDKRYGKVLDEEASTSMDFAVSGAKRMHSMINDLLQYARLGREETILEEVDLEELLGQIRQDIKQTIEEKNARLDFGQLPVIRGVSSQWRMLFQNLIENGLKFNESVEPTVKVRCKDSPDFWILSVSDNGIGIEDAYRNKIFELFQRLHPSNFPGTGIGLAMCKRIVEVHGGSIWIEPNEEEGTTFFFTIEKDLRVG